MDALLKRPGSHLRSREGSPGFLLHKQEPALIPDWREFLPVFSSQRSPVDGQACKRAVLISDRGQVGRFPAAMQRSSGNASIPACVTGASAQ